MIPRNVRLAEAPSYGVPALKFDRNSKGAQAYLALAGEMLNRAGRAEEGEIMAKIKGLGRGLDALLGADEPAAGGEIAGNLAIDTLQPGSIQPRTRMARRRSESSPTRSRRRA